MASDYRVLRAGYNILSGYPDIPDDVALQSRGTYGTHRTGIEEFDKQDEGIEKYLV